MRRSAPDVVTSSMVFLRWRLRLGGSSLVTRSPPAGGPPQPNGDVRRKDLQIRAHPAEPLRNDSFDGERGLRTTQTLFTKGARLQGRL